MMNDDCISRAAAIEAVKFADYGVWGHSGKVADAIRNLPTVVPERWIPCSERLPEELTAVIITWKNHEPEPYYSEIKHKPFVGVGIHHREKWWWWSAYAEDMLAEYGDSQADRMDDAIEVTAWMPLPDPYRAERSGDDR